MQTPDGSCQPAEKEKIMQNLFSMEGKVAVITGGSGYLAAKEIA